MMPNPTRCGAYNHCYDLPEILTPFATAFRYPGGVRDLDPADVVEAIELARSVRACVNPDARWAERRRFLFAGLTLRF